MEKLSLQLLEHRRKSRRVSLLKNAGKGRTTFSSAYEDLLNQSTMGTVQTHYQERGQPRSVGANGTKCLNSFLPRTNRDLKIGHNRDHS